jgi:ABC-type glycerol-3-phosphate transport system substrate-binding protein
MPTNDNPRGCENSSKSDGIGRRPVIKATGAGILAGGLAGCSGDNSSDGGSDGSENTSSNGGSGSSGSQGTTKFSFWDTYWFKDSPLAKQTVKSITAQYQADSGDKINLNMVSEDAPINEAFKNNKPPQVLTMLNRGSAPYISPGFLHGVSNFQDTFSSTFDQIFDAIVEGNEFAFQGWEESSYIMPLTSTPFAPFIARMDHFKQAGLDPEKDFPPKDYEDLVRIATKLQQDGPGQVGYQIYGCSGDIQDVYTNQWLSAQGGADGLAFGDDWSTSNMNNDIWKNGFRQIVDIYQKHDIGVPKTPTLCDEPVVNMLISGQVSMAQQATQNMAVFTARASSMFENGKLKWGEPWGGPENIKARNESAGAVFPKKPEGKDQATWDEKQSAATDLIKFMSNSGEMSTAFPKMGFPPVREDKFNNIEKNNETNPGGWLDVCRETLPSGTYEYEAHPVTGDVYYEAFPPHGQQALKGEKSPEKACEDAHADAQEIIDGTEFGGGGG